MRTRFKLIYNIFFLLFVFNIYSYEIVRDPIFEDYFDNISQDLELTKVDIYLIKKKAANAFVIGDNIYLTTGLLEVINNEETLKAIYLHEYGHVINNHYEAKKIKIIQSNNKKNFYNLFSFGLAILGSNSNIAIGTSITLNSNLVNEISKHSVIFEIEADNFMIENIKKNKINTIELISFLKKSNQPTNSYFMTHPNSQDRINNLKEINYKKLKNSKEFEWIKSKYSNSSNNQSFDFFFENLEKGIFNQDEKFNEISQLIIQYEAFKSGIFVENWENKFQELLKINNNSFLKIEYINYLLDNNISDKYRLIENLKFNKSIMNEYFYHYIYGKYYGKIDKKNLSNFYFCQFYKNINLKKKADLFCEKYDIKDIPILDKSYAIFE